MAPAPASAFKFGIVDKCACATRGRNNGGIAVRVGKEDNWQKTNERHYVTLADSTMEGPLGARVVTK